MVRTTYVSFFHVPNLPAVHIRHKDTRQPRWAPGLPIKAISFGRPTELRVASFEVARPSPGLCFPIQKDAFPLKASFLFFKWSP